MTEANSEDASKVGYKRPPRHSRFRSGQSGNPRGRERGVRNLRTDVKATLAGSVVLNERGKAKRVSTQEAMLLRLKEKALKAIRARWNSSSDLLRSLTTRALTIRWAARI
jgi:Family of unknown function (DUF5681)